MKKAKAEIQMRKEYDFSGGVRGKYAGRYARGTNVVLLDADVAEVFKDSSEVNSLLRGIAGLVHKGKTTSSRPMVVREKTPKYGK